MDLNGIEFVDLMTDADQILLYNMSNVHTTSLSGQELMQQLIDEEIELLQKCVYGCVEHHPHLQQHQHEGLMGSEPREDTAVSGEKSATKEESKETSEDTQPEGAHCESTENVKDNETDKGTVDATRKNVLKRKVSHTSGGSQYRA